MNTKIRLGRTALDKVQELVRINVDGSRALFEAAAAVEHEPTRNLFKDMAAHRLAMSEELTRLLILNDEEPNTSGTAKGALQRAWSTLQAALHRGDPTVVLAAVQREEERTRETYERALAVTSGSSLRDVLMRHYRGLQSDRDLISALEKTLS